MKISVVIPNYNGAEILKKNFSKIYEAIMHSGIDSEIIISDDASTDDSIEVIKSFINELSDKRIRIKLITAEQNKGFSSNVNKAVENATGSILILLNTDVSPNKDFITHLIKHFDDEKVFAVGCLDESVEGKNVIERGRGRGHWEKGFLIHSAAPIEGSTTLWVSGGSGVFRKSIWDKLGGLDVVYDPFYWEDIDLSYRALKSGYKIIFENKSVVRHEHEKGVIKKSFKPKKVKQIVYRNQFIFAWKNSDTSTLMTGIFWLPYHIITATISGDLDLIAGFIKALSRLTTIITSRRNARKLFIKSDKEVTNIS